jgi:hypothetical protein
MTRRRLLVVSVLAALAACIAAPAGAAVRPGTFAGTTSEGDAIGFAVDRKGRVVRFRHEDVSLRCSDGDTVTTPKVVTPAKTRFRIRSGGFGIKARNDTTGFGWDADGLFRSRGRKARGTLKIFASFNDRNEQDADGAVKCESAAMTWTAARR